MRQVFPALNVYPTTYTATVTSVATNQAAISGLRRVDRVGQRIQIAPKGQQRNPWTVDSDPAMATTIARANHSVRRSFGTRRKQSINKKKKTARYHET